MELGMPEVEKGDRIVLPRRFLLHLEADLETRSRVAPGTRATCQLLSTENRSLTNVGLLSCDLEESDVVCVPEWVLQNLRARPGELLKVSFATLKAVDMIRLQPETYSFVEALRNPRETMEFILTNFTCLTTGQRLPVMLHGVQYWLIVKAVKPGRAVHLQSAECRLEFDEPLSGGPAKYTMLTAGVPVTGATTEEAPVAFYTFKAAEAMDVEIELVSTAGDPDVFVACENSKPGPSACVWHTSSTSTRKSLTIPVLDPRFPAADAAGNRVFYLGVTGYQVPETAYSLTVRLATPAAPPTGHSLVTTTEAAGGPAVGEPGQVQCESCGSWVPEASYVMHSAFCARNNTKCNVCNQVIRKADATDHWHCPVCKQLVPLADREKHHQMIHADVRCTDCGAVMPPDDLEVHQKWNCPRRKISCKFCNVDFPAEEMKEHREYCRARTIKCDICGKSVVMKRMDIHLATEHNINPSLLKREESDGFGGNSPPAASSAAAPAPVTAKASAPLVEPHADGDFPCEFCGSAFLTFEDLQLHMLTDCVASQVDADGDVDTTPAATTAAAAPSSSSPSPRAKPKRKNKRGNASPASSSGGGTPVVTPAAAPPTLTPAFGMAAATPMDMMQMLAGLAQMQDMTPDSIAAVLQSAVATPQRMGTSARAIPITSAPAPAPTYECPRCNALLPNEDALMEHVDICLAADD